MASLNMDDQFMLHDITCLWVWLRPKLGKSFGTEVLEKHDELFMQGHLRPVAHFAVEGSP